MRAIIFALLLLPSLTQAEPCSDYPCAHYSHVATGLLIGYIGTKYFDAPKTSFGITLGFALAKETWDGKHGKVFSRTDVLTRVLGAGVGIYIAKAF